MSTFKKVISIVLCLTMVLGTFAIAGDLFVPKASAAVGESQVESYDELVEAYGDDFIYYGIDVMEYDADGKPYYTDHYVEAGDTLQIRHYIKSSRFIGNSTFYLLFDAAFFDLKNGGSSYPTGANLTMNPDHEAVSTDKAKARSRGLSGLYTAAEVVSNTPLTRFCGYSQEELDAIHKVGITTDKDATVSQAVVVMKQDTYFGSYDVMVRADLEDGAKGKIHQDGRYWKATTTLTGGTASRAISDIMNTPADITAENTDLSYAVASNNSGIAADKFITDTLHEFTIGANPNAGSGGDEGGDDSGAAAAGTSQIESYADLEKTYGSDFIYYGIDVMEYDADGNPYYTDHYVEAGDTLQIRHYIKSSRFIGNSTFYLLFDAAFFDLKNGGSSYPTGANLTMNPDHEAVSTDKAKARSRGLSGLYTAAEVVSNTPLTRFCGYSQEELDAIHKVGITTDKDATVSQAVVVMKQDTYFGSYDIKVKAGLADGTKGKIHQDGRYWKATTTLTGGTASRAISDIMNTPADITDENTDLSYAVASNNSGIAPEKFITDTLHEFTIGANPNAGGSVSTKPSAIFVENDGTQISKTQYNEGEDVVIPEAVDGQIGWANTATGEVVEDLTGYTMPKKTVTFQRVLSTDEFEITLNVDGGEIADLPEGVTANEDGTLSISAGIGETVSLANIAPTKTGYTGKWNPEEITLDNIKGATVKIEWTANTYNVKFYAEKGDESTVTTIQVTYDSRITNVPTVEKEGFSFVNWKSVADDSILNTRNTYTVAGDSAYYAEWSLCDSAINFMIKDYSTGEWKLLKSFYGNNGETLAKINLDNIRNNLKAEDIGWDGAFETDKDFAFSTAIGSGYFASKALTYDGTTTQTIYVNTYVSVDVEWDIPVYDEANDVYGETVETVTTTVKMPINGTSSIAALESAKFAPATGFTLAAWNNADGEEVSNYRESSKGLNFTVSVLDGATQKYVAVYEEAEYEVAFAIGDTLSTVYTLKTKVSKGDVIDLATAEIIDAKGNEATLPAIGEVSNKYDGKKGNKLIGWRILGVVTEFPVEITKEFIEASILNNKFTFNATWEPQAYDATFTYEKADGTTGTITVAGITVDTSFDDFAPGEEVIEMINSTAPKGQHFSFWGNNGPMTSGGRTFTAVYEYDKFNVYIDHGNGKKTEDGKIAFEVRELVVTYGDDAWAEGDKGIASTVTNIVWTGDIKPEGNALPTGWEIYHLDENADLYDESTWKAGINDDGSSIVESALVFRATWKGYNEFWFRVMDTTNHEYCALGKNFKMYYFKDGRASDRKSAILNPSDSTIILLFKPVLENFSWDGFFKADMWNNVSLRFDPIAAPKSMFTLAGMTGIFRAIFDAIVNGVKELF